MERIGKDIKGRTLQDFNFRNQIGQANLRSNIKYNKGYSEGRYNVFETTALPSNCKKLVDKTGPSDFLSQTSINSDGDPKDMYEKNPKMINKKLIDKLQTQKERLHNFIIDNPQKVNKRWM